ncbi:MAG TPA: signal peptidase I [Nitrososphaeraceae archaeon]|nr:signal peptidase I [Nitrososphaeraceae archaeon]
MSFPKELKYIIIAVIIVGVVWIGIKLAFGVINPFYVVASESMIPRLNVGDFVVVSHNIPFNELKVKDIIVFKEPVPDGEEADAIVHRVNEILTDPLGNEVILTKGDANSGSIPGIDFPIYETNYVGKVVVDIPKLGLVTKAISPPVNYIIIAIILVILFFLFKKGRDKPH